MHKQTSTFVHYVNKMSYARPNGLDGVLAPEGLEGPDAHHCTHDGHLQGDVWGMHSSVLGSFKRKSLGIHKDSAVHEVSSNVKVSGCKVQRRVS